MSVCFARCFRGVCCFLLLVSAAAFADSPMTLYKIDPTTRGPQIATIVSTFNSAPYSNPAQYEVAIQTGSGFLISPTFAPLAEGGFIPYVKEAIASTNGTLLIVTYNPSGISTRNQYIVIPVEKMAAVMYSPQEITEFTITSNYPTGELPRYDVDPVLRAADLASVFSTLNATLTPPSLSPYFTGQDSVGIFTTLSGPFNPPIYGGFIPYVQSVTASGAYLIIEYLPVALNGKTFKNNATIIVTAEQVIQMVYYAKQLRSPNGL